MNQMMVSASLFTNKEEPSNSIYVNPLLTDDSSVQVTWNNVSGSITRQDLVDLMPVEPSGMSAYCGLSLFFAAVLICMLILVGVLKPRSSSALSLKHYHRSSFILVGTALIAFVGLALNMFIFPTMASTKYYKELTQWESMRSAWEKGLMNVQSVPVLDTTIRSDGVQVVLGTDKPVKFLLARKISTDGSGDVPYVSAVWVDPFNEQDGPGYWTQAVLHYPAQKK